MVLNASLTDAFFTALRSIPSYNFSSINLTGYSSIIGPVLLLKAREVNLHNSVITADGLGFTGVIQATIQLCTKRTMGFRMTSTREPLPGRTMPRSLVMVSSVAAAPAMALLEAIVATMEVMVGATVDLLRTGDRVCGDMLLESRWRRTASS